MGIDVRIESENGTCLAELLDPHNRMNRLLSLAVFGSTRCLQFIDPYGDTVFNRYQIPVLQSECSALVSQLTAPNLSQLKRAYLERAETWPKRAVEEAQKEMEALSLAGLQSHLESLLDLISKAIEKGAHHYLRFVGDDHKSPGLQCRKHGAWYVPFRFWRLLRVTKRRDACRYVLAVGF